MNETYSLNRHWSDQFIPDIRRIVGAHLLSVAPDHIDMRQATDLLMLDGRDVRIAARVRRHGYAGLIRQASNGYPISSGDRRNQEGTCFKWFDIRSFPSEPPLVLATSGLRPSHLSMSQACF